MCMLHTWTWVCKHVPMEARGLSFFVLLPWDRVWNWTGSALLWLGRPAGESLGSGCLMLGLQVHVAVPDFICVNVYVCVCRLSAFHSKCLWKEVKDLENGASWSLKQIEKRVCVCVYVHACACACVMTFSYRSEDNIQELMVSFYQVGPLYRIQVVRFGAKHVYPLRYFAKFPSERF